MITLTHTPQPISFAGCSNHFELLSDDILSQGSSATISFNLFDTAATPGDTFALNVDGMELVYMLDSRLPIPNPLIGSLYRFIDAPSLLTLLTTSEYLRDFEFRTQRGTGYTTFTLTSRNHSAHTLAVTSATDLITLVPDSYRPGTYDTHLPNYSLAVRYQLPQGYTPWVYLNPINNLSAIDTSMLVDYLPKQLPPSSVSRFEPIAIPEFSLSYRLQFAEYYGSTPILQTSDYSEWFTLFPGELSHTKADRLLPDWHDAFPNVSLADRFTVLGSDTGRLVDLRRNEVDYIYLLSTNSPRTISVAIDLFTSTADAITYTHTFPLDADTLYALPLCPILFAAVPLHTAARLAITYNNVEFFSRTYRITESLPGTAQLYLADKYGLLRSLIPATLQRSVGFEADSLLLRRARTQTVTRRTESFTATSSPLTQTDSDRLADSLSFDRAFMLVGSELYPIHISPSSLQSSGSERNLTSLSFSFFVETRLLHPIPYNLPPSIPSPIPDTALLTESGRPLATESYDFLTLN